MSRKILFFITAFILWLLLSFNLNYDEFIIGVLASLASAIIFGGYFIEKPIKIFQIHRWFWLLIYIPIFAYKCLEANLDVALRVLHPGMPLKPGIIKIKTNLKTEIAKTFLANSITLTPGTMTCEIEGDTLYIHWIWVKEEDEEKAKKLIAQTFEKYLKRIFE
uniref:Na+/H+ antiporter subunit D n=1 Tax=candidate division WOR-3 bacterium TaxID=2052148 RepID=A0A7V4E456_UNCW3